MGGRQEPDDDRVQVVPCPLGTAEFKQLQEDGYEPVLKVARWLLLKRPANQTKKQAAKLEEILKYNLKSVSSHLMKEDFQQFWEYSSPTWAGKFLDQWCMRSMRSMRAMRSMRSKIDPMKKVARMLRNKTRPRFELVRGRRQAIQRYCRGF